MAFLFWKKKAAAANDADNGAAAQAQVAVDAAVASAQRSDKEWQRQAARLRQEEKRREKQRAKAAKHELAEMKKQAKQARKARAKADKVAKKQARMVLKVQKRERKAERKRAKAIVKLRRASEKRRKRLVRKRQREERRRRKQARAQGATPTVDAPLPQGAMADASVPLAPPLFKEDTRCKSCHSTFQRLPTRRRHHCRNCGESFCSKCLSRTKRPIPWFNLDKPQKVCFSCDVQVFNGMGGTTRVENRAASPTVASATPVMSPTPERGSPLRSQRSVSFQSEQPEDSPRTVSPPGSRTGLSLRLHPRSRRDTCSTKSKKSGSLWSLPIRPLLKRKSSADQLRNRNWDLDLRLEKEEMLARQRQSQMIVVTGAPEFATAS